MVLRSKYGKCLFERHERGGKDNKSKYKRKVIRKSSFFFFLFTFLLLFIFWHTYILLQPCGACPPPEGMR